MRGDAARGAGIEARRFARIGSIVGGPQVARRRQPGNEIAPAERAQRVEVARLLVERAAIARPGRFSLEHGHALDLQGSRSGKSPVYLALARAIWRHGPRGVRGRAMDPTLAPTLPGAAEAGALFDLPRDAAA